MGIVSKGFDTPSPVQEEVIPNILAGMPIFIFPSFLSILSLTPREKHHSQSQERYRKDGCIRHPHAEPDRLEDRLNPGLDSRSDQRTGPSDLGSDQGSVQIYARGPGHGEHRRDKSKRRHHETAEANSRDGRHPGQNPGFGQQKNR